ncbi:hypothetical protein ACFLY3_04230 [Chloroflexota bacterium]
MSKLTNTDHNQCVAKFPCQHRKGDICIFRIWEKAFLEALAKSDPENHTCYRNLSGLLVKPCLEQDEEGQNPNGEVRNL